MFSNVFEVSVDFLLKDEKTEKSADEKGYYVSREMAVGVFGIVYWAGTSEAYENLVHNDEYSNRVWFKIKRKISSKLDK